MIKIVIAEDKRIFRDGLKAIFASIDDFELIGEADNGEELLDILTTVTPDIILMDIEMPVMDGIEATKLVNQQYPDIKIVILSLYGEISYIKELLKLNIKGYLLKGAKGGGDELVEALRLVYKDMEYYDSTISKKFKTLMDPDPGPLLTTREIDVVILISEGFSNKEIADMLYISTHTVNSHRKNLLLKSGAKNTAQLIMWGVKNKFLDAGDPDTPKH